MRKARTIYASYVRGVLLVYVQVYLCGACIGICVRRVLFMYIMDFFVHTLPFMPQIEKFLAFMYVSFVLV